MGGGSGTIIVRPESVTINRPLSLETQGELNNIASRSPVTCGKLDALRLVWIIWQMVRA